MSTKDFAAFFTACWGYTPFAWQTGLARRVLGVVPTQNGSGAGGWPEVIALPTASGKTACIDIAVFALAVQADHLREGQRITAPRRIFFVVDRRVIVDEAYDRARKLAHKLETAQGRNPEDGCGQSSAGLPRTCDRVPRRAAALGPCATRRDVSFGGMGAEPTSANHSRLDRGPSRFAPTVSRLWSPTRDLADLRRTRGQR